MVFGNRKTLEFRRNSGVDKNPACELKSKKMLFLLIFGIMIVPACFSQNLLFVSGDYNPLAPDFWSCGIGFNLGLTNNIQNDLQLSFGQINTKIQREKKEQDNDQSEKTRTKTITENGRHFSFGVKDSIYYTMNGQYIGLRAGVSASLGVYSIDIPEAYRFFVYGTGLVGVCFFPKSLLSLTLDVCPGYIAAFQFTNAPGAALNDSGFILPITIGIRFNLDKL